MAQEFVWPLALAYALAIPGNRFHGQPAVREWVVAGIRFAARSAHRDGSCDDYFPYERAVGAAAFSLLAGLESARLLDLRDPELDAFFRRRAEWLARQREAGRLANHEALTVLGLRRAGARLGTAAWDRVAEERLRRLLSWQDAEGWFQEYEGADLGYQTLTIWALAELDRLGPRPELRAAIAAAVRFAAAFVHPDGSWGGEYGSRNTHAFFPAGFEVAGTWLPEAPALNDRVLAGLAAGRDAADDDDHVLAHTCWNRLLAWAAWRPDRPSAAPLAPGRSYFPNAGLLVDRRAGRTLVVALNKGGVFRHFAPDGTVTADTGPSLVDGRGRNAVAHLVDRSRTEIGPDRIVVEGTLGWAKHGRLTPVRNLALRGFMLTIGRCCPNLVRRLLQRLLITGKRAAPYRFRRELVWTGDGWSVRDRLEARNWNGVQSVLLGTAQTSIYVVMSRTFQDAQFRPPDDLAPLLRRRDGDRPLELERRL